MMPIIHVSEPNGTIHRLDTRNGMKLMEVIRDAGLPIEARCGGGCACGTCHVHVEESRYGELPDKDEFEEELLEFCDNRKPNSRLSCQIEISPNLDGLHVTLAE